LAELAKVPLAQPVEGQRRVARRHLQPLAPPDPLDPLGVHQPACLPQQRRDLAIAVAAILACQRDGLGGQPFLVVAAPRRLALRRAVLAERRADAALGAGQDPSHVLNTGAPARGA
jgi:hypothetical protein